MSNEPTTASRRPARNRAGFRARVAVGLVLLTGLAITLFVYRDLNRREQGLLHRELDRRTQAYASVLQGMIDVQCEIVQGVGSYFTGSENVTRAEFHSYCTMPLKRHAELHSIEWIPRVPEAHREAFETGAREDGLPGFMITERGEDGTPAPAARRDEYFPVYYIEPPKGHGAVLGLDLGSAPAFMAALESARDAGTLAATIALAPQHDLEGGLELLLVLPVYEHGAAPASMAERRQALVGFAVGATRIADMAEVALSGLKTAGLDLSLVDDDLPAGERLLHFHPSRSRTQPTDAPAPAPENTLGIEDRVSLAVAGRRWTLVARPAPAFGAAFPGWQDEALAGALLAFTVLVAVSLGGMLRAAERQRDLALQRAEAFDELAALDVSLRDSEQRFRVLFEGAAEGIAVADEESHRFQYANPTLCNMLGFTEEELTGMPIQGIHPVESLPAVMETFNSHAASAESRQVAALPCIRKDGSILFVDINAAPVEIGGRPCVVGFYSDATERTKAAAALAESRDMLRSILETVPARVFWKDKEGRYLGCNSAFARDAGVSSPEDLLGKDDFQMSWREQAELYRADDRRVMDSDTPKLDFEEPQTTTDGSTIWLRTSKVPLRDGEGRISGLLGIYSDVTDRKRAERELRRSEERFRALTESTSDWIWEVDSDARFTYSNPKVEDSLGFAPEEIVGRRLFELLPEAEADRAERFFGEKAQKGEPFDNFEVAVLHRDGHEVAFQVSGVPVLDADGVLSGYRGINRDITEHKQIREKLLAAMAEADAANRAKSEFLANMSHEIRTPMNGVMGMTDLLMDTVLTREQREFAQTIKSSSESLLAVINDILDFSKIEAHMLELDPVGFNLRDCLADILQTLALRAAGKSLELAYDVGQDVQDAVVGDPGRLRQVIVNLVGNALKFTDRGEIVLRVESVEEPSSVTGDRSSVMLQFSVADTGVGMSADTQARIFNAFAQADASTTRKYGGTGLGLSISASLVELMGGRIWMDSEVGRGTTCHFTVRMGIQPASVARPSILKPLPDALQVLVVDDNETNQRILTDMLTNWRMQAVAVGGGEPALKMLAEATRAGDPFLLLLLDAGMPGMDGYEVAERVRETPDIAPAIIMLTSAGRRGDAARCKALGVAAYLTKPIKPSTLLDAIMTVLGGGEPDDAAAPLVTRHTLREAIRPLRLLLAEDNPVNQKIAVNMLEKRGHAVTLATNGAEVLDHLDANGAHSFDIILMDVQMPVMDGFQATARIREREKTGGGHIPIIALTARAMKGDREECLAGGMDAYVSKPLRTEALLDAMAALRREPPAASPASGDRPADESERVHGAPAPDDPPASFDPDVAMTSVDGDMGLLREVASIFKRDSLRTLSGLQAAIRNGDAMDLNRKAHALKGSAGAFGGHAAAALALALEEMGGRRDLAGAEELAGALALELRKLTQELDAYVGGIPS